jgi:O-antigen/teichoic acid export membrane protein
VELNVLGAEDYGLYQVVAGVVAMFSIMQGTMSSTSQRYFSIEIGQNNIKRLKELFSLSVLINIFIIVIVFILAETIGLWFINNKIIIPETRRNVSILLYHFSIFSMLLSLFAAPYMADIIAHENMGIYAFISIVEAGLKLGVVFILQYFAFDKLLLYGILLFATTIIVTGSYISICVIKYKECQPYIYLEKRTFQELLSFNAFSSLGAMSNILRVQGINILINQFFSPVVVTSRAIAVQVQNAVFSFSLNFRSALTPRLTMNYATPPYNFSALMFCAKLTFFLTYIFVLPLIIEAPYVLTLWLVNPPVDTMIFLRIGLIEIVIMSLASTFTTVILAGGKIKLYYIIYTILGLVNIPLSYIAFRLEFVSYSVAMVSLFSQIALGIFYVLYLKQTIAMPLRPVAYLVLRITLVILLSAILPFILAVSMAQTFISLIIIILISFVCSAISMFFLGFNKEERMMVIQLVQNTKNIVLKE